MNITGQRFRIDLIFLLLLIFGFSYANFAHANTIGNVGNSGLIPADNCTSCHTASILGFTAAPIPTVTLTGPSTATVAAGSINSITFTMDGGPLGTTALAGFNFAADGGTFPDPDMPTAVDGIQLMGTELTHDDVPIAMTGTFTQTFEWEAPMTGGTYTIYAAGLSADGDGTEFANGTIGVTTVGDGFAMTTIQIIVDPPVINQAPVAMIAAPATSIAGIPVAIDASGSTDDGTIVTYDWDFGDTMVGTGINVMHTYATAGTYIITLTVTDDGGLTNMTTSTITVEAVPVNQDPVAVITAATTGTEGMPVTLDASGSTDDGTIVTYDWDFGDTMVGTGVNVTHTYATAGTYTITLTVTDDLGATNVATTSITISAVVVDLPPVAVISAPATASVGMEVSFDGSGSTDDGTIISYAWDFGDTTAGIGVNTAHTYTTAGTYTISLTVMDDAGASNTATASIIIEAVNQPPVAMITSPASEIVGIAVTFDGSGSTDDGTIVAYAWDFGDATLGAGMNATHIYAAAGTYTVMLTVTDDAGATNMATTSITIDAVANQPPVAMIMAPFTKTVGIAVRFDGSGSTDDGTIASYVWDFGDTTTGTGVTVDHAFTVTGSYTVTLTVTDDAGLTNVATTSISITPVTPSNFPPIGVILTSQTAGSMDVAFDASNSTDSDGTIVSYDWDFGDTMTGSGINVTHTYAAAGTYTVTLAVTDNSGATTTSTDIVTLTEPVVNLPPAAMITSPSTEMVGAVVAVDGSGSTDDDGTIVSYDWDFGDTMTGTGVSTTHTYATAGTFTITLTVTDDAGATNANTASIIITDAAPVNVPPVAMISGPTTGTDGVPVDFDASGSVDVDGTIVSYDWDFGDTTTGVGVNVSHAFVTGVYTVTLTVTDDGGASNSATADIVITPASVAQPPMADAAGPYAGDINVAVMFDGSASMDPDGTIVTYDWDFGDTNMGTGVNPSNTYAMAGTYTVTLTVTDNDGMAGSVTTMAVIVDPGVVVPPPMPTPGDGEALYDEFCSSCHGAGGTGGSAENIVDESSHDIIEAIMDEPSMTFLLDTLNLRDIMLIAYYLDDDDDKDHDKNKIQSKSVTLYNTFCASCHGADATGGIVNKTVLSASVSDIKGAIAREQTMAAQVGVLSDAYLAQISDYLVQLDVQKRSTTRPTTSTSLGANDDGGGGAVYWLSLFAAGVIALRRRKRVKLS